MKVLAKNRRATFDYNIEDRVTAGLVLEGTEVKAIRTGRVKLQGAYCQIINGELWLVGSYVGPYANAGDNQHEEDRTRKLLVTKRQLQTLVSKKQQGRSIVPIVLGSERGKIKLEIGYGLGKKRYDKRRTIQQREDKRRQAAATKAKGRR